MKVHNSSIMPALFFIVFYAIAWTFASYLFDPSVPYDAIEALNWASNYEFGSPKNPYLVGAVILPALFFNKFIPFDFYWYATHFLAISIGMFGIWLLSLRLFYCHVMAFFSLMSLNISGIINFDIIPYNDNYLLVMIWPYLFLFFIKAIYDNKRYWLLLALFCGLATMSKYSSLSFLPFMLSYILITKEGRKAFKYKEFYFSILLFICIIAPNALWLYEHDFAAFDWVGSQIDPGLNGKIFIAFLSVFYPVIIMGLILFPLGGKIESPNTKEKRAVIFILLPPIFIIFIYFLFNNGGRITEWLQPFSILAPLLTLLFINVEKIKCWNKINLGLLFFSILVVSGYVFVLIKDIRGAGSKRNYIKPISLELNNLWQKHYNVPLKYVGGGNLSEWLIFYAPDHPKITTKWSNQQKPNVYNVDITEENIITDGGLFLSESGMNCQQADFSNVKKDFPTLNLSQKYDYNFITQQGEKIILCLAFVPPK